MSKERECVFFNKNGYFNTGWRSGTVTWSKFGETTGSINIQSYINEHDQYIRFNYVQTDRHTDEKKDFDYKIPLTTTPCNYGSRRFWFVCPWYANGIYCGRRVGVLYKGGDYFACRHCYNLTYDSRNLSGISKMVGQVISMPELEKLEAEAKRKYYAGKPTRKYQRFLKKQDKSFMQLRMVAEGLNKTKRIRI